MHETPSVEVSKSLFPVEVRKPTRIISAERAQIDAPEFNFPRSIEMTVVGQRQAKFGDGTKTFFTPAITQCELEILRTFNPENAESTKFAFMHVQSGDLTQNEEGSKIADVAVHLQPVTCAVVVSGSNSINVEGVSKELEKIGVIPIKNIVVDTRRNGGNSWMHVAFRPKTDEILVKVGSDEDFTVPILVFSGFRDIRIDADISTKSTVNRDEFLKEVSVKDLIKRFQTLAEEYSLGNYTEAEQILSDAKEFAAAHKIDWNTLPEAWGVLEQRLMEKLEKSPPDFAS